MRKNLLGAALLATALAGTAASAQQAPAPTVPEDPHAWLEEMEGERALNWASAENEKTLSVLQSDPRYQQFYDKALAILQAKDRIATVGFRPDGLHNFWQDETHVRGLWRRTSMESYRTDSPEWETILDIDALAAAEQQNWVYEGASCLPPNGQRCLVHLSIGGKDATVVREFDVAAKAFVKGGFDLPEGKQRIAWLDADTLLLARDWGEGTLTTSGYPFVVKELKRGQPLAEARELFRGEETDVSTSPFVLRDITGTVHAVGAVRGTSYFDSEYVIFGKNGPVKLDLPAQATLMGIVDGRLLVSLREDWSPFANLNFKAGSLISYDLAEWKQNPAAARPSLVFEPTERQTLGGLGITRSKLILTVLDNVRGKAFVYDYVEGEEGGKWTATPIALPDNASVYLTSTNDATDEALFSVSNYLMPTTLWHYDAASDRLEVLKQSPERFDASNHVVEQMEATSKDGAKIPYFLIRPKTAKMDGTMPTLLYGYGGFQIPQVPYYSGPMGRLWLEQGNAYVVANLRGGGEFGPKWHQAARAATKQKTWDDFIAVAEDLIQRRVTSPRRLGIMGGSQGGLLVGTAITQRPELYNAAVIQVPLFDMLRYTKLGAGSSWISEYGDPDIPEQRAWIEAYSPYQKLAPGKTYPTPFILTSTKDDRVHPAHGRKAAAKLSSLGQPYFYYENIDGGHSAAANLKESARRLALEYTYLTKRLVD